jgi:hypothetical protein
VGWRRPTGWHFQKDCGVERLFQAGCIQQHHRGADNDCSQKTRQKKMSVPKPPKMRATGQWL